MPPELGNRMVKVQHLAKKEHCHRMVTAGRPRGLCWGSCSSLLSLLCPRGILTQAARSRVYSVRAANAWRDAEETEGPCRGSAWFLSAYSVSGQQAESGGARRAGQARLMGNTLRVPLLFRWCWLLMAEPTSRDLSRIFSSTIKPRLDHAKAHAPYRLSLILSHFPSITGPRRRTRRDT